MKELLLHPSIGPLDKEVIMANTWRTEITCDVADFKHGYDKKENTFAIKVSTPWMVALN